MARLPTPGGDNDKWGNILNDFLAVAHNTDGSLKLPFDLGAGLVQVDATGQMSISPNVGEAALIVHSFEDDTDTLQVNDTTGNTVVALKPTGIYTQPTQPSSVGLFVDGSALDSSSLLLDLENGGSVLTVNYLGGTTIKPSGDTVNLTLQADSGQTVNLQEWRDSSGNVVAWVDSDGNPGGTLAPGFTGWTEDTADPANVNSVGGGLIVGEFRAQRPASATMFIASEAWGGAGFWLADGETLAVFNEGGASGKILELISAASPRAGFYGVTPVVQQTAADGDSLVLALQNYGLLDSDASWSSNAVTTDHDFFITGDGTLPITETQPGVGFGVESGNSNPHIEVVAPASGGTAYIDLTVVGSDYKARLAWNAADGTFSITGPNVQPLTINSTGTTVSGGITAPGLPLSDPHVYGAMYRSAGNTVMISAG